MTAARLTLTREQILRFRRCTGALDARLPAGRDAARRAAWAGLCDSAPRAALLSLHARVEAVSADALDDPGLIQVWGPRYSCYVIDAADRALFTLGRLPIEERGRERAVRIATGLARRLQAGESDDRRIAGELGIHPNALKYATTTGTVQIRWDGARAPDMSIVQAPDVDPDVARRELARRHLHVFGPTTADGFAEWAGVSKRTAAHTYAALEAGGQLVAVRTPIGEAWILAGDEAGWRGSGSSPGGGTGAGGMGTGGMGTDGAGTDGAGTDGTGARLLPSVDAYTLAQGAERELLVPDPVRRAQLWPSRVWPGALLLDGELSGVWRRAASRLSLSPWRKLNSAERATIEAEAATLPIPGLVEPLRVSWSD